MPQQIKLPVELVPASAWYSNLRAILSSEQWKAVSRWAYRKDAYRCVACGGKGPAHPVEAHERWVYLEKGVQRLTGVDSLCPACHLATHLGFAQVSGKYEEAFLQLMLVNNWTKAEAERYVQKQFEEWERRSSQSWQLDLSWLASCEALSSQEMLALQKRIKRP